MDAIPLWELFEGNETLVMFDGRCNDGELIDRGTS
jgi:hypothetical protein